MFFYGSLYYFQSFVFPFCFLVCLFVFFAPFSVQLVVQSHCVGDIHFSHCLLFTSCHVCSCHICLSPQLLSTLSMLPVAFLKPPFLSRTVKPCSYLPCQTTLFHVVTLFNCAVTRRVNKVVSLAYFSTFTS